MKTKFKGTSGKWLLGGGTFDGYLVSAHHPQNRDICTVWAYGTELSEQQEMKLNSLLISKVPELLLMLESIVKDFEMDYVLHGEIVDSPYEWLQDRYKEAKQLIEDATNI